MKENKREPTKFDCANCLKECDIDKDEFFSDVEGNVFCSKECRTEFRKNKNDELNSIGE